MAITITIERKEGDIGFALRHNGVYPERGELYEGSFGTIDGLRQTILQLLERIDEQEDRYLTKIANSDAPNRHSAATWRLERRALKNKNLPT